MERQLFDYPLCSRRAICAGLVSVSLVAGSPSVAAPVQSSPQTAKALFQRLAKLQTLEANFREEKQLALLKMPLITEGRLYYARPGYLLRSVEKPSVSRVRIGPERLEVINAESKQTIDLRSRPDVKLFVESFTRVLAGDGDALSRGYKISFQPAACAMPDQRCETTADRKPWRLRLVPKSKQLGALIRSLEMEGHALAVHTIRVVEAKGDVSVTHISNVRANRPFTAAQQRDLFGKLLPKR